MSDASQNFDLAEALRHQSRQDLALARAVALDAYAAVEASLCALFARLLGTDEGSAGIVFYRINNARSRNGMIEKLLKRRKGADHNLWWNSMVAIMRIADERRNEIVHWHGVAHIFQNETTSEFVVTHRLEPPNYLVRTDQTPSLGPEEMAEFVIRCDFIARSLNMFMLELRGKLAHEPWHDIFRQPAAYPPPDNHPLARKPPAPESPPQPSPE
jgi:hypothetical protein